MMEQFIAKNLNKSTQVHNSLFPNSFRMLIVGSSGCGKTCLLMRLLLENSMLNYNKLYIFARSLYQPQYIVLKAGIENNLPKSMIIDLLNAQKVDNIDDIAKTMHELIELGLADGELSSIEGEFHTTGDKIPDPQEIDRSIRNLIIFDDIMNDKQQTPAENYYTRGRSASCDCIYLSQNYTKLPLHTIRSNSNFMVFFKSPPLVVEQLHRNFSSVDMTIDEWRNFCKTAWNKKYGFIVIDLSRDFESGNKYRTQLEL